MVKPATLWRPLGVLAVVAVCVFVATRDRGNSAQKRLFGRWEGVRLSRIVEGQPVQSGIYPPGGIVVEFREDGSYQVVNGAAPNFNAGEQPEMLPKPVIFNGKFQFSGDHSLRMVTLSTDTPELRGQVGKVETLEFAASEFVLVTLTDIRQDTSGVRIGSFEASYRRAGEQRQQRVAYSH